MQSELIETKTEQYHKNGFLQLRGLFNHAEVLNWQKECDRLQKLEIINPGNNRAHFKNPELPYPESIDPVVDISPLFKKLADDERITSVLGEIFQDNPALLKDKLIYHLPGNVYSALHQDWVFGLQYLATADDLISVALQIDAANSDNGCVELFEQQYQPLNLPNEERPLTDAEKQSLDPARHNEVETAAGDVLILHPLTPHRNGKNHTTYPRRTLYLIYNAAHCGILRDRYYEEYLKGRVHEKVDGSTFF